MAQYLLICVGDNDAMRDRYVKSIAKFHSNRSWWVIINAAEAAKNIERRVNIIFQPAPGEFDTMAKRSSLSELVKKLRDKDGRVLISRVVVCGNQVGEPITRKEGFGEPYDWK